MKEEHERALAEAGERYLRTTAEQKAAAADLADAMRAAYADGEQQTAIIRAAKYAWSREYLRLVLGLAKRPTKAAKKAPAKRVAKRQGRNLT